MSADPKHYDFPPFPPIPSGVTIIPFSEFIENGIAIYSSAETGEEVDGLGIPTVELKAKHPDTDECKSDSAKWRKKKAQAKLVKSAMATKDGYVPGNMWWDVWEEAESVRWMAGKNAYVNPLDRFHQAARDFKKHR